MSNVHREHVIPLFRGDFVDLACVVSTGVVHKQIETSQIGDCIPGSAWNGRGIAKIAPHRSATDSKLRNIRTGSGGVLS